MHTHVGLSFPVFPPRIAQKVQRGANKTVRVHMINVTYLAAMPAIFYAMPGSSTMPATRSIVRVGQSEWDDIKILGHQMGHLISKFHAIWDTSFTCQVQLPNPG